MDEMFAAQLGMKTGKKPTHRGRRSRGKGPKMAPDGTDPHSVAKGHILNAHHATDPKEATTHLFKALTSLKKC